ncbi:hypothetical protein ACYOEI_09505 [Singulisphaera rosea]
MSKTPSSTQSATVDLIMAERFRRHAAEWKQESHHLSNPVQIAMLKPYQRIIGMGPPVVPMILEELSREPNQWFWALEAITAQNPVPPEVLGEVRLMAEAWIQWGERQDVLATRSRHPED